jgi:hypothetical protein
VVRQVQQQVAVAVTAQQTPAVAAAIMTALQAVQEL